MDYNNMSETDQILWELMNETPGEIYDIEEE